MITKLRRAPRRWEHLRGSPKHPLEPWLELKCSSRATSLGRGTQLRLLTPICSHYFPAGQEMKAGQATREVLLRAALRPAGVLWSSKHAGVRGAGKPRGRSNCQGLLETPGLEILRFYIYIYISPVLGRQQLGQLIPACCHLVLFHKRPFFDPRWWSPGRALVLVQPCCSPAMDITGRLPSPRLFFEMFLQFGLRQMDPKPVSCPRPPLLPQGPEWDADTPLPYTTFSQGCTCSARCFQLAWPTSVLSPRIQSFFMTSLPKIHNPNPQAFCTLGVWSFSWLWCLPV